jgi:hypothetical protein
MRSWDSSVGIVMGYRLDGPGSVPGSDFSLLHSVQTDSGATQPRIQWVPGALPLKGKAAGVYS